ncbi:MAG TPA: hypothetical protein PLK28_18860, partial [Candidatus Rifleibacterium sp.]|nr:hypothetical protein [Candidatus Rifleibacterium sp.]
MTRTAKIFMNGQSQA